MSLFHPSVRFSTVAHGRPYSPLYLDFCSHPGSELRTGTLHVSESFWDFFGMDIGAETFGLQPDALVLGAVSVVSDGSVRLPR